MLVVLILMVLALFFFLRKEISDINNKSKVYFTQKAQEYTDSIKRKRAEAESSKEKKENKEENKGNTGSSIIYVEKKANYEIDDLLKIMKQVDDSFAINNESIIKNFIDAYVVEDEDQMDKYESLKEMQDYVNEIGVYNIMINDKKEEIEKIVKDLRLMNEDVFMEFYSGKEEFMVGDFCNFLDYEIGKCDPTIYVYVGNTKLNYDKLDERIKTLYDKDIYKGIKIVYYNKLYDYSLS